MARQSLHATPRSGDTRSSLPPRTTGLFGVAGGASWVRCVPASTDKPSAPGKALSISLRSVCRLSVTARDSPDWRSTRTLPKYMLAKATIHLEKHTVEQALTTCEGWRSAGRRGAKAAVCVSSLSRDGIAALILQFLPPSLSEHPPGETDTANLAPVRPYHKNRLSSQLPASLPNRRYPRACTQGARRRANASMSTRLYRLRRMPPGKGTLRIAPACTHFRNVGRLTEQSWAATNSDTRYRSDVGTAWSRSRPNPGSPGRTGSLMFPPLWAAVLARGKQ